MTTINSVGLILAGSQGTGAFVGSNSPTITSATLVTPASLGVQQQALNMNNHAITNLPSATLYTPIISSSSGSFGSITYFSNVGQYMQFGNLIIFVAYIQLSALTVGTASGELYVSLPVAVGGGVIALYQSAVVLSTTTVFTGPTFFQPVPGTSFCHFVNYVSSTSISIIPPTAIGNSGSFRFSGIYFTS